MTDEWVSYVLVIDSDLGNLEMAVREYLNNGYRCAGGVAVDSSDGKPTAPRYIQALEYHSQCCG